MADIKACHELNYDGDFLAGTCRSNEVIDDGRIGAGSVQRLLDRQDIGVDGGQRNEVDDRRKRLVGMVQQHIFLGQHLENIFIREQLVGHALGKWRVQQFRPVGQPANRAETIQIHRALDKVHVVFFQAEVIEQEFLQVLRAFMADLDAYGGAIAAGLELAFERSHEIADLFIVDVQVAVARHAELVTTVYLETGEKAIHVHANDR